MVRVFVSMIDVEQLRNGNEDTLTRLMEKYHRPLIYFSFQYVKILEVAEDIVSETFINFWELRDNFQNESKIKSFLYISTKNTCLNHLKSHQSKRRLPLEEIHESQLISDVDINSRIIKSELLEVIYTAIKKLPEKQQNVLKLTFDKDMSTEQICSELGISPVTLPKSRTV